MPELSKEQLYIILVVIFILIIGCIYGLYGGKTIVTKSSPSSSTAEKCPIIRQNASYIVVNVSGAVKFEGIYRLEQGDRLLEAVRLAKVLPDADMSAVNLAETLSDGQKVVIPYKYQKLSGQSEPQKEASKTPSKVNINKADAKEFDSLPGIGPTMAARIVDYRNEKGRFSNIEQLKEVQGISDKKFNQLRKLVTVN